jgi:hypothetical protein
MYNVQPTQLLSWGKEHKTGKHTSKSGAAASCDDDFFRLGIINGSGFGFRLVDIAQESCFVLYRC